MLRVGVKKGLRMAPTTFSFFSAVLVMFGHYNAITKDVG